MQCLCVLLRRLRPDRTQIVLFAVAFCIYLPGIHWGLPHADSKDRVDVWATDDISPLAPLTEVYNTFVEAGPDRHLVYPLAHHFLLTAAYAPYLIWLKASGGFGSASAVFPFGLEDPVTAFQVLTLIARLISVSMAAAVALVAYRIGLVLWDRRTGILAYAFCAAPYTMFYYSKTGNLEVPVLFWTSLGVLVYAVMLRHGLTPVRAAALGVFAAMAAATKDQGAAMFLLMPLAFARFFVGQAAPADLRPEESAGCAPRDAACPTLGTPASGRLSSRRDESAGAACPTRIPGSAEVWKSVGALLASGLGVYSLASGLVVEPSRWSAHVAYLFDAENHYSRFERFVKWYPATLAGQSDHLADVAMSQVWFLGPLLLIAALVGIARSRPQWALLLPALGHLLLFLLPLGYFYLRFAMPISFVLALFAARGAALFRGGRWLVPVLLAWPLVLSADLMYQMIHDSRYAAERWLADRALAGQKVAHFAGAADLPRLPYGVDTLRLEPDEAALDHLRRAEPEIVVIQPDWTSPHDSPHSGWCPPELYRGLEDGSLGYVLVARFRTSSLVGRRLLDYPTVNPPIRIYVRRSGPRAPETDEPRVPS